MRIKSLLKKYLLNPPQVVSMQTLGQTIMLCSNMFRYTNDDYWKIQGKHVSKLLISYQNRDGGFGIGYDWPGGGKWHKKFSSTSPELEELYAIIDYYLVFRDEDVRQSIEKGINWIRMHSFKTGDDRFSIPYDPTATRDTFINNGVSFSLKCLAAYNGINQLDDDLREVYYGYVNFLEGELERSPDYKGRYWRYFHQRSPEKPQTEWGDIIENHHMGQQLESHCIGEKYLPCENNRKIVEDIAEYLDFIQTDGIIRYSNLSRGCLDNHIDIWGYASCIKGFVEASRILERKELINNAEQISSWLIANAWNGEYFNPEMNTDRTVLDNHYYPRTDAWVLASISHLLCEDIDGKDRITEICQKGYNRLNSHSFKGEEKFAWDLKRKIIIGIYKPLISLKSGKRQD